MVQLQIAIIADIIILIISIACFTPIKKLTKENFNTLAYCGIVIAILGFIPAYVMLDSQGTNKITQTIGQGSIIQSESSNSSAFTTINNNQYSNAPSDYAFQMRQLELTQNGCYAALEVSNKWIKDEPNNPDAWYERGVLLYTRLNNIDEAKVAFNKAQELGYTSSGNDVLELPTYISPDKATQPELIGAMIPYGVQVSDLTIKNEMMYEVINSNVIECVVKNMRDHEIPSLYAYINIYDPNGSLNGTVSGYVTNLQPGASKKIIIDKTVQKNESFKLEKIVE